MKTQEKLTPAQVANECEMLATQSIDDGDREAAALYLTPCHAIRHLLRTLARLNDRVHSGYDFNVDPDGLTLEVGDLLAGKDAILDGDRLDWLADNHLTLTAVKEMWSEDIVQFWQVTAAKKSLSGHPESLIRVAIDNAMLGRSNARGETAGHST
jgi:hypothetical protein